MFLITQFVLRINRSKSFIDQACCEARILQLQDFPPSIVRAATAAAVEIIRVLSFICNFQTSNNLRSILTTDRIKLVRLDGDSEASNLRVCFLVTSKGLTRVAPVIDSASGSVLCCSHCYL